MESECSIPSELLVSLASSGVALICVFWSNEADHTAVCVSCQPVASSPPVTATLLPETNSFWEQNKSFKMLVEMKYDDYDEETDK